MWFLNLLFEIYFELWFLFSPSGLFVLSLHNTYVGVCRFFLSIKCATSLLALLAGGLQFKKNCIYFFWEKVIIFHELFSCVLKILTVKNLIILSDIKCHNIEFNKLWHSICAVSVSTSPEGQFYKKITHYLQVC